MSRHQLDFERSITHNEDKVRSLQHLTSQHSNQSDDPNDPINKLDDIWKDISYKQMKTKQIVQRRSLQHLSTPGDNITEGIMSAKKMNKTGKHDCERECYSGKPCTWQVTGPANRVVCKKGNKYCLSGNVISVVKKDTVKPLQGDVTDIPDHVITRYRLSLDEIKQLPRFADYQKGEPSNVSDCTSIVFFYIHLKIIATPHSSDEIINTCMNRTIYDVIIVILLI